MQIESLIHLLGDKSATLTLALSLSPSLNNALKDGISNKLLMGDPPVVWMSTACDIWSQQEMTRLSASVQFRNSYFHKYSPCMNTFAVPFLFVCTRSIYLCLSFWIFLFFFFLRVRLSFLSGCIDVFFFAFSGLLISLFDLMKSNLLKKQALLMQFAWCRHQFYSNKKRWAVKTDCLAWLWKVDSSASQFTSFLAFPSDFPQSGNRLDLFLIASVKVYSQC